MCSQDVCVPLFLSGFGVVLIISGIRMRLGIDRTWFGATSSLRVAPVLIFGFIPMGLGLLSMALWGIARDFGWLNEQWGMVVVFGVSLPLIFLGPVFAFWRPRFICPRWYLWLLDNYGPYLGELREDAQRYEKENRINEWAAMVRTQEGLEQWAESVRQRVEAEQRKKGPLYHT